MLLLAPFIFSLNVFAGGRNQEIHVRSEPKVFAPEKVSFLVPVGSHVKSSDALSGVLHLRHEHTYVIWKLDYTAYLCVGETDRVLDTYSYKHCPEKELRFLLRNVNIEGVGRLNGRKYPSPNYYSMIAGGVDKAGKTWSCIACVCWKGKRVALLAVIAPPVRGYAEAAVDSTSSLKFVR